KSAASLEQALEAMADLYLQKNDPLEKAKRSKPLAPECVWKVPKIDDDSRRDVSDHSQAPFPTRHS
ncbi:hypothetical protein K2X30_12185, partial [bacterium]|nr:hypothetical protein [bacterium]